MHIYGKRAVFEALKSMHQVDHVYLAKEMQRKDLERFKDRAAATEVPLTVLSKAQLQKYCGPVVHQGIVAQMPDYRYINKSDLFGFMNAVKIPLILVLDQIQDTHNLGAIIRTAEICGVTAIIIPEKTSAEINPTVAKTSAGAVFHINIYRTRELSEILDDLKKENLKFAALMPGKNENIYQTKLDIPMGLIIGSEGAGVRKNLLAYCDLQLSIPQMGKLDSLNASVSSAVVLFEVMRQKKYS